MVFRNSIFGEVRHSYPEIASSQMYIGALAGYFILHPERPDRVVTSNLSAAS